MTWLRMSFNHLFTAGGSSLASVSGQMFTNLAYLMCEVSTVDMFAFRDGMGHLSVLK